MVSSDWYNLDQDNTLGGNNPSILKIPSQKAIKEALNTKQDTLVSGSNIKTINNTSLLGSGDITISGGTPTDVQINGTSITSNNVANIVTNTAYNSSSNKIATMSDIPANTKLSYYGTCDTAASTRNKVVVCAGFTLAEGASIRVKFTYAQTYNGSCRLNVNNTGNITVCSVSGTGSARYCWLEKEIVSFTYDGTYWVMEDSGIATTTYYGTTKLTNSATSNSQVLALSGRSLYYLWTALIDSVEDAPVYSEGNTYSVGDVVKYNYNIWSCNTAITTAEEWTEAHWTKFPTIRQQINSKQDVSNLVTTVSSSSTDAQYPSAKLFYDTVGNIESALNTINSGSST